MTQKFPTNKLLTQNIIDELKVRHELNDTIYNNVAGLINEYGVITFNDETGYPIFMPNYDTAYEDVVGVRTYHENYTDEIGMTRQKWIIEFNVVADEKSDYGVDESAWFNPLTCGDFEIENLFDCFLEWVNVKA